ncbi:MAG: FAD synthase [Aigarchaeota archaeon]|nr:FAD synthase [Aigarchaeota archaeon]MDW8092932.1 adenylyltransferase/cytidyltransferase family protein [Nitrososphaerota archaeon]
MVAKGRVVLTTGAFDLLHPGHIFVLRYARRLAGKRGRLIVLLARDVTVRRNKGRPPLLDECARLEIIRSIKFVDEALLGYKPLSFEKVMRRLRPDVIVFGYDQKRVMSGFLDEAMKKGWRVKVVRAPKLQGWNYSTSKLLVRAVNLASK